MRGGGGGGKGEILLRGHFQNLDFFFFLGGGGSFSDKGVLPNGSFS